MKIVLGNMYGLREVKDRLEVLLFKVGKKSEDFLKIGKKLEFYLSESKSNKDDDYYSIDFDGIEIVVSFRNIYQIKFEDVKGSDGFELNSWLESVSEYINEHESELEIPREEIEVNGIKYIRKMD